jgi:hypothetical protein
MEAGSGTVNGDLDRSTPMSAWQVMANRSLLMSGFRRACVKTPSRIGDQQFDCWQVKTDKASCA